MNVTKILNIGMAVRAKGLRLFATTTGLALASVMLAGQALAESGGKEASDSVAYVIEEVIVTARKREESLQNVPVSVSVFSAHDLEKKSIVDFQDLGNATPNFEFMNHGTQGNTRGVVTIRGIGQTSGEINADPGVGVYIDGIYLGRNVALNFGLLDIASIEVLRGPQGTLYGKNTIGGAVSITTAKPTYEAWSRINLTAGDYSRKDGNASLNFPLIEDTLAIKLAASTQNRDGYGTRIDYFTGKKTADIGNEDRLSGRAQVLFTPTSRLEFIASLDGTKIRETDAMRKVLSIVPLGPVVLLNRFIDPPYDARFLTDDELTSYATGSAQSQADIWSASLTAQWRSDNLTIKSMTAYRNLESLHGVDPDGSPWVLIDAISKVSQDQFTQELQVNGVSSSGRLNWTVGAFYMDETVEEERTVIVFDELYQILGLDLSTLDNPKVDAKSYAAFAQASMDLTDRIGLTAGARYSHEKKEAWRSTYRFRSGVYSFPPDYHEATWDAFTPHLGVEFKWMDDAMLYLSASRGFKSGGFNARPKSAEDVNPYDPEYVWTYEFGLKSEFFNNRARLNAAVYYSDYKDIQFQITRASETGQPISFFDNAGKAEVKGFELEFQFLPVQALELSGGVGYIDAKYTEVDEGAEISTESHFSKVPKWTTNVSAEYTFREMDAGSFAARVDYAYKSTVYHDVAAEAGASDLLAQVPFSLINARLTFAHQSGDWEAALFGTNLTDERYFVAGTDFRNGLGFAEASYARPREWSVSFTYMFR
jgi:iron complex outermembrane receptor protein